MDLITFLIVSFSLFFLGLLGIFLNRKNVLLVLMSAELILLSVNLSFLITASYIDDRLGQVFAIFVLTVASAESSIGLAILVSYYRVQGTIALDRISFLKG